jgi:hypothetical protein
VRWRLFALLVLAGVLVAATGTAVAVTANVATGSKAQWFPPVGRHPLWWMAGATTAVAGAWLLAWWAGRRYDRELAVLVPAVQRPEPWVVDRPAEVDQIVAAVRYRGGATVGITTAVHGAGGFGKTTVAKLVRADRRVLRRFGGRVYWVTLGRDVRKEALARKVNDLIARVEPGHPVTFTDARQAGEHLAAVLAAGPRRLVVLDDVWFEDQVAAFPVGGRSARLVTTRNPSLVARSSVPVKVDQMSVAQARAVLLADLPQLPPPVVDGLVNETGRWPLLLRLINKILVDQARLQLDVTTAARDLLDRLCGGGVRQVDQLTGADWQQLDVSDPDQRQLAVQATIGASTGLLTTADRSRFAELAVFAVEHPGFGGDSILPRCSGLGGRCLPRYRRLAEPRSDHFPAFVLSNICPAALSSCPPGWRAPPAMPRRGFGHLLVGHPLLRRGFPGQVQGDAQRHRLRRRRRP